MFLLIVAPPPPWLLALACHAAQQVRALREVIKRPMNVRARQAAKPPLGRRRRSSWPDKATQSSELRPRLARD